jgi:hypothetical protein
MTAALSCSLSSPPAAATVPAASAVASSTAKAESDATLIALGAKLSACDALKSNCPEKDDEQYAVLDLQHWDLREKINRIPAATLEGLRIKARAAEFAIKGDEDCECVGAGSFIGLAQSINRDLFAMETGA